MQNYIKSDNFLSSWLEANPRDRLTPEDEITLPSLIQKMEKIKEKLKKEDREATPEEYSEIEIGQEAFNKILESNIPLGIHFAKKYASHYPDIGLTVDDLTQEAMLGIINAAKKYDPGHACKFSTYAAYWINQAIRRAIEDKGDLIRKPASAHSRARKVHKIDAQFNTHVDSRTIAKITGMPEQEIEFIRLLDKQQIASMDQNFFSDDEEEQSFHESIPDNTNVLEEAEDGTKKSSHRQMIDKVKDQKIKWILRLYYGYTPGEKSLTIEELSLMQTKYKKEEIKKIIEVWEMENVVHNVTYGYVDKNNK